MFPFGHHLGGNKNDMVWLHNDRFLPNMADIDTGEQQGNEKGKFMPLPSCVTNTHTLVQAARGQHDAYSNFAVARNHVTTIFNISVPHPNMRTWDVEREHKNRFSDPKMKLWAPEHNKDFLSLIHI